MMQIQQRGQTILDMIAKLCKATNYNKNASNNHNNKSERMQMYDKVQAIYYNETNWNSFWIPINILFWW